MEWTRRPALTEYFMVSIVNLTNREGVMTTRVSAARAKAEFADCVRKAEAGRRW